MVRRRRLLVSVTTRGGWVFIGSSLREGSRTSMNALCRAEAKSNRALIPTRSRHHPFRFAGSLRQWAVSPAHRRSTGHHDRATHHACLAASRDAVGGQSSSFPDGQWRSGHCRPGIAGGTQEVLCVPRIGARGASRALHFDALHPGCRRCRATAPLENGSTADSWDGW